MGSRIRVQEKIVEILNCIAMADDLVNCHIADFFVKDLWQTAVPTNVRDVLEKPVYMQKFPTLYRSFLQDGPKSTAFEEAALHDFLVKPCRRGTIDEILTPAKELLQRLCSSAPISPTINDFMSEKKKHEVMEIIPVVGMLAAHKDTPQVIDVGSGKGYLSATLAHHTQLCVLSLDSSPINTEGAAKMEKKMKKKESNKSPRGVSCRETVFVAPELEVDELLVKHFGVSSAHGLLGLHTCGNLASTCCRLFVHGKSQWLLNVGCCYHLIDEEFSTSTCWNDLEVRSHFAFPMSMFLREKRITLGRNARMLAAHSLNRVARDGVNEKSALSLFYRAILQVLIYRVRGHTAQEGNIGKLFEKCKSFKEYIRGAERKLKLDFKVTEKELDELWEFYWPKKNILDVFFLLRINFAPLIENVILLDRLLYLEEEGIQDAYLVPLFDGTQSPRNKAIISWKQNSSTETIFK